MNLNPNLNLKEARAWPSRARRGGTSRTQLTCRGVAAFLFGLLALMWPLQAQAQHYALIINSPAAIAGEATYTGALSWAPVVGPVSGVVAYEGDCCPGSPEEPFFPDPLGKVVMIDTAEFTTGQCTVSEAVNRAAKAGAIAVLVAMPDWFPGEYFYPDMFYDYLGVGAAFVPTLAIDSITANLIKGSAEAVSVTLTLPPGVPGASTLPVTGITTNSATLNGSVFPNGVETNVHFEYWDDAGNSGTSLTLNVGSGAATLPVTFAISGLISNMTHYAYMVATAGDITTYGTVVAFRTASLPEIIEQPADQLAMVGEQVVISAVVIGGAPLSYQWSHNGSVAVPFGTGSPALNLSSVTLSDAGSYRLEVINPWTAGTPVSSTTVNLTVVPAVPPAVATMAADPVKKVDATLNGTVNPNGGLTMVYFEYGPTTAYGKTTTLVAVGNATFPQTFNSALPPFTLEGNTTYHFRFVAASIGGTVKGADVTFTTLPPVNFIVVNTLNAGAGSLRDAIAAADLADTIHFDPGLNGQTITLTSSLFIDHGVRIFGPGAGQLAVSGNNVTQVMWIDPNVSVVLAGLTIRNGSSGSNRNNGGGIVNSGSLTLEDCTLSDNKSLGNSGSGGGALLNLGPLTVRRCLFTGNRAVGSGGAIWNLAPGAAVSISDTSFMGNGTTRDASSGSGGGAIFTRSTMTVIRCRFQENSLASNQSGFQRVGGGALYHSNFGSFKSEVTVIDSTFAGNSCNTASGGAILTYGSRGQTSISGSTFAGNRARGGGAIEVQNGTILSIENSTLSGNTANYGGALSGFDAGQMTLRSCTITGNISTNTVGGGIRAYGYDKLTVGNSIIAGNNAPADPDVAMFSDDGPMPVESLGHNIIGIVADDSPGWSGADLTGSASDPVDPVIGPLADNGGPTRTHALLPGSSAMDVGDTALADSTDDQRGAGFPRLYGKAVDVGAYEVSDPLTIHSDVLFDLIQWRDTATDSAAVKTLASAINKLSAATAPSLWQDKYRPAPATGHAVFTLDLAAVGFLTDGSLSAIDLLVFSCMADRIARADREIAATGIDGGTIGGSSMATALAMLAKGDNALTQGNPAAAAIAHYQSAWKQSLKTKK